MAKNGKKFNKFQEKEIILRSFIYLFCTEYSFSVLNISSGHGCYLHYSVLRPSVSTLSDFNWTDFILTDFNLDDFNMDANDQPKI